MVLFLLQISGNRAILCRKSWASVAHLQKKREDYTSALGWEKGTCNPRVMCVGSVVYFDCVSSCRQMRNALKLVAPEISVVCWQRQHLISSTPPPVLPLRGGTCGRNRFSFPPGCNYVTRWNGRAHRHCAQSGCTTSLCIYGRDTS